MGLKQFSLENKVAIVTGATRGIGQGIAVGLAEAGADIVGVATGNMDTTKSLVEALGRQFLPIQANLVSLEPVEKIVSTTVNHFGRVDILVNNAGIIRRQPSLDFSVNNWDEVMNINLRSAFFLGQRVAKEFVKQNQEVRLLILFRCFLFKGNIYSLLHCE